MIEKEKVKHIADLARLTIQEEEYPKYQQQLQDILTEIEKITEVEIPNDDIMISPITHYNRYREDTIGYHISKKEAFKNAKNVKGDYIVVPKVM